MTEADFEEPSFPTASLSTTGTPVLLWPTGPHIFTTLQELRSTKGFIAENHRSLAMAGPQTAHLISRLGFCERRLQQ